MDPLRIRLVFNDQVLTEYLKSAGLKRCWILLDFEAKTISDVASFLYNNFDLPVPSSDALILSMDGFVLPPFESTRIFKDKDIVRVKKNEGCLLEDLVIENQANSLQGPEILGKKPVLPGGELLVPEEFEKETGGYQSEPEGTKGDSSGDAFCLETTSRGKAISKKRKSSKKLQSEKKRIKRSSPQKDHKVPVDGVENDGHIKPEEGFQGTGVVSRKTSHKKSKSSKKSGKSKKESATQVDDTVKNTTKSVLSEESSDDLQENGTKSQEVSPVSEGMKKTPSRSARRKKAKRNWLRELANSQKKEMIQSHLPEKPVNKRSPEPQQTDDKTDKEPYEIVPVVVRPGHIRFEPLDEDQVIQRSQDPVESFQWNGTTSKKKGQKWGKEKTSVARNNDYKGSWEVTVEKPPIEERKRVHNPIDFEKLELLPGLPKEGDVVAYRVVELSSSWCPELSPFRVGKVSSFDSVSNKVVLVPVPEYPIVSDENQDETLQVDDSLYRADGSLQIDFAALVGVRIVKHDGAATVVTGGSDEAAVTTKEAAPCLGLNNGNGDSNARVLENGGPSNVWEEFSKALDAKRTQLLSEKGSWNKKESSGRGSWSYRAMRSSALGPSIAQLRSGNEKSAWNWR